MRMLRSPWTRAFLVWTVILLAAATLVALDAVIGLYRAGQACYFQYPLVPCPQAGDPLLVQLHFAFFGFPLIFMCPSRRPSAPAPRRPLTIPGLSVWTSTRRRSRVLSLSSRLPSARRSSFTP